MEHSAATNSLLSMMLSMMAAQSGQSLPHRDVQDFMPGDWDGRDDHGPSTTGKSRTGKPHRDSETQTQNWETTRKIFAQAFRTAEPPPGEIKFASPLPGQVNNAPT